MNSNVHHHNGSGYDASLFSFNYIMNIRGIIIHHLRISYILYLQMLIWGIVDI